MRVCASTEPALGTMVTIASLLSVSPQLQKSLRIQNILNVFVNFLAKEIVNTKKFDKTLTENE